MALTLVLDIPTSLRWCRQWWQLVHEQSAQSAKFVLIAFDQRISNGYQVVERFNVQPHPPLTLGQQDTFNAVAA
jgi:hypothetical protein